MNNIVLVIAGITVFVLSMTFVRVFCDYAIKRGLLDIPNARSSHQEITPRGGGVVFVLMWYLCLLMGFGFDWFSTTELVLFIPSTFLVSLFGYWDDHKSLTAKNRLLAQCLAAIYCVVMLGPISSLHLFSTASFYLGWTGMLLAVLALVWSTNVFNFMDGLDGIAAMEALFVFGVGGLLFWHTGEPRMAVLAWALVVAVSGFLVWNCPKAKIFMGDVGTYCLGLLVPLFALIGDCWYDIPVTLWVILYGVFWFDATLTVLRRLFKGENLALPHREHAFHRLHSAGFSNKQILCGIFVLNSILATIALWMYFNLSYLKWGFLLAVVILTGVYLVIEKIKPMSRHE